jgi:hypothetical protein
MSLVQSLSHASAFDEAKWLTGEIMMFGPTQLSSKRRREDVEEPESEQRITKRLARMRIGQEQEAQRQEASHHHLPQLHLQPSVSSAEPTTNGSSTDDHMYLDDTKDKVYIYDLESEIAQIEAAEPKGIFLADIERKISAIPPQLLHSQTNTADTQLVLYQVPSSISVPEEQDHVRKAIIAARARARDEQARQSREREKEEAMRYHDGVALGDGLLSGRIEEEQEEDDPDAMDLA